MSAINKLVLANLEATEARLSEGRQWIGIRNLEIREEVQPRAGIDNKWVSDLRKFVEEYGSVFPPITVYQLPGGQLIPAAGHHRIQATRNMGKDDILCEIIDGSLDDAIVYATGSNRGDGPKRMTDDDKTKAIEMLLSIDKWWNRSASFIGKHVGCVANKVIAVRSVLSTKWNKPLPDKVVGESGERRACNPRNGRDGKTPRISTFMNNGKIKYQFSYNSHRYHVNSIEEAKAVLTEVMKAEDQRKRCLKRAAVASLLLRHGFRGFGLMAKQYPGLSGWHGNGMIVASCDFSNNSSLLIAAHNLELLAIAIGKQKGLRQIDKCATRSVVLCYKEDGPVKLIELFEQAGYEFMTPDELVFSLGPVIPEELKKDKP